MSIKELVLITISIYFNGYLFVSMSKSILLIFILCEYIFWIPMGQINTLIVKIINQCYEFV